jgi:effector-binding domain-containing protein
MSFKYEIKEQKVQPTASIRTRTSVSKLPDVIQQSYETIGKHLEETEGQCIGAPFAIYYNMDINDLDVELGFPVAKPVKEKNEIKNSEIPAAKVLTFTHVGPYNELEKSYGQAMAWIKDNNINTAGTVCEFYLNDPDVTPPSDLETEIRFFLKN